MAAFNMFNCLPFDLMSGKHDFANDTIRVYLSNATPNAANTIKSDLAEITSANGYNDADLQNTLTQSTNVAEMNGTDVQWTANGGNFGPFRYPIYFNNDATPDDEANCALIGWYDYGSSISCNNGESFTLDLPANGLIANCTNA